MTGTVGLAKACDGLRVDFDLARGCRQLAAVRIFAETADLPAIIRQFRQDQTIARPEFIETWGRQIALRQGFPRRFIKMFQPLPDIAAFGEGLAGAEALGEISKDLV